MTSASWNPLAPLAGDGSVLPAGRAARENLVFTSVSNVLKLRHDTAKNSISNVR